MRKPEADMPTDWDKHLRAGGQGAHGIRKKQGAPKREYYHRLRHRLKADTRKRAQGRWWEELEP